MNSNPYFPAKDIYQKFVAVVIVLISCWLVTFPAFAASAPLEVKISLGSGQGEMNYPAASGRGIRIKIDSIVDFGVAAGILGFSLLGMVR
jgi:hypothetical protein